MAEKGDTTTTASVAESASGQTENRKVTIKSVDMSDELQAETIKIAITTLSKYSVEKDVAAHIKKEFDRQYGPTWHVVVGKNFGSYVTHGEMSLFLAIHLPSLQLYHFCALVM